MKLSEKLGNVILIMPLKFGPNLAKIIITPWDKNAANGNIE